MLLNRIYKILTILFIEFRENFGKVRKEVAREMAGIAGMQNYSEFRN